MANTNTASSSSELDAALANIPKLFRRKIINSYLEIKKRYSEAQFDSSYDAAGLSAGKFTESVFRFLQQHLTGAYIPFGQNIPNFADESRKLIQLPATAGPESLRVIMPRALVFLYTLRGKRGIGHVGGDIEANGIDAATIVRVADWVICELIRSFHGLSLEEAQTIVDALSSRNLPIVWEVGGKKRILRNDLDYKQKVLLLIYSNAESAVMVEDLFQWTEYSNLPMFKKSVLMPMHRIRLIEYDKELESVYISPTGIQEVEDTILRGALTPSSSTNQAPSSRRKAK